MEIKITTKFDLGDTVFFLSETTTRVIKAQVTEILFYFEKGKTKVYYRTEPYSLVREELCYRTREDIINQL